MLIAPDYLVLDIVALNRTYFCILEHCGPPFFLKDLVRDSNSTSKEHQNSAIIGTKKSLNVFSLFLQKGFKEIFFRGLFKLKDSSKIISNNT